MVHNTEFEEPEGRALEGPAREVILREIGRQGPIPFERFMELALYAPDGGYYQAPDRAIGRGGDFYTSVSVGPVFGFLVACWAARRVVRGSGSVDFVEAAAHDGSLASDVLGALREFAPGVFQRVRYIILEPTAARRRVQERKLAAWGDRVAWISEWTELGRRVDGVIFANELLDAMPVRRFEWDWVARRWWESGVGVSAKGDLAWCRLDPGVRGPDRDAWPEELLAVLPEGFVAEACPAAESWWHQAAEVLSAGWLVTADYGFEDGERVRPERCTGTLRGYHRHRLVDDLLARPGGQDLTAHVDFGGLRRVGEGAGLVTEMCREQGRWLSEIAVEILREGGSAATWLATHAGQLQTLTHPVHLGRAMRVLVQRRSRMGSGA